MPPNPLHRPLQFVTGKGGVGKSVVAAAIAWRLATEGRRVLLYQVNAEDSHSDLLEVSTISTEVREIVPNLYAANATPASALREYGLLKLRFRAVYSAVFENRLVKHLLRFVPSLAELTILGKAWFHLGEAGVHTQVFDHVVIDAPATGHGLNFIRVARVVADGALPGPLKSQAEAMAQTVEDPERTSVHVVCLPEQLAVEEAKELTRAVRHRRAAPLGIGVINRFGPHLFEPDDAGILAGLARVGDAPSSWGHSALARAQRDAAEVERASALREETEIPWREIPELLEPVRGRQMLEQIGGYLFDPR